MGTSGGVHRSSGFVHEGQLTYEIILLQTSQLKALPKGQEPKYNGEFSSRSSWKHASVWRNLYSVTECRL